MKRVITAVTAAVLAAAVFTACGSNSSSSETKKNIRVDGTAEEAIEEMVNLTFLGGDADKCYEYMYPVVLLDQVKAGGAYKALIDRFKLSQDKMISDMKQTPEFKGVTATIDMTDDQLAAAARYFSDAALQFGVTLDPESINITKGCEVHYEFVDYNGKEDSDDNECMVYVEGDGWKNIFYSAAGIEERYPDTQSSSATESVSQETT